MHGCEGFSLMELSAIKEIANIGLGHATTALATVTGRPFNIEIPNVETVAIENVPMMVGEPDGVTVGICMPFEGDVNGTTAFLFPWASAQDLWEMLLGVAPPDLGAVDDLAASAMLEVGNIVSSSFLNAISDMTALQMHATPPMVSIDTAYAIASSVVAEADQQDVMGLAIETKIFGTANTSTTGYFLCVPTLDGIQKLFSALGIAEAA